MQWNPWALENWTVIDAEKEGELLPLVSIGVLNYNRCDDLRVTLDVLCHGVLYGNTEIIVVDNGSSDGSIEMMEREYPNVRLHKLEENIGTCARNIQTSLARGKYLFSYDNDSIPGTPGTISRIVTFMEEHPDVDVLNGMCYQPKTGITETDNWEQFRFGGNAIDGYQGIYLVEGGVCYRLSTLRQVQGFDCALVYAAEGPDLALQLYKKQARIILSPWFLTLHFKSPAARLNEKENYWRSRHTVWMIAKHFKIAPALVLIALYGTRRIVGMMLHPSTAWRQGHGFIAGVAGALRFFRVQPKLTVEEMIGLKRFYIQLLRW